MGITHTTNLNLIKPDRDEQYTVTHFSQNMDLIDDFAGLVPARALTSDKLTTGANINGVKFDGTTDITLPPTGANSDLSNLTTTGEKHFLNKSQITNCILEAPNGVANYSGNVVTVPTGVKALVNSGLTNADGTIKNIEVTILEEQTINVSATGIVYLGSDGTLNTTSGAPLVSVVYGTSSISAIYPYSPVELLKQSDKTNITKWSFPSDKRIKLTLGASGTTYTAPADGWFSISARSLNNNPASVHLSSQNLGMQVNCSNATGMECKCFCPVKKGDKAIVYYANVNVNPPLIFNFCYAVGSEP